VEEGIEMPEPIPVENTTLKVSELGMIKMSELGDDIEGRTELQEMMKACFDFRNKFKYLENQTTKAIIKIIEDDENAGEILENA